MTETKKSILVIGAGDATGSAIAKRFAREGFAACVVRRNGEKLAPLVSDIEAAGGEAHAYGVDARKEDNMISLVAEIEENVAPIEVAVFNKFEDRSLIIPVLVASTVSIITLDVMPTGWNVIVGALAAASLEGLRDAI